LWILNIWVNEEKGYKKYQWNPIKDWSKIIIYCFIIIAPFRYLVNKFNNYEQDSYKDNILFSAVYLKKYDEVKGLITKKYNLDEIDSFNMTPLMIAIRNNDMEMVTLLAKGGAKTFTVINKKHKRYEGYDALDLAVKYGNIKILKFLISKGFDINRKSESLKLYPYPIFLATLKCSARTLDFLISKGANVNLRDNNGNTPLHLSAKRGCFSVSVILGEAKADFNLKNKNKKTPYDIIRNKEHAPSSSYYFFKKSRQPASK